MYKLIALVVVWGLSGIWAYNLGVDREAVKLLQYRQKQQALIIEQEQQHTIKLAAQLKDKENAIKTINKRHAVIVSGLRKRAERPPAPVKEVVTPPVSSGAGSTGESLYREDAEFLIGEAAKADILREALNMCRKQAN